MSLLKFEKKYWKSLDNQRKQLVSLYEKIKSNVSISLEEKYRHGKWKGDGVKSLFLTVNQTICQR